MRRFRGLLFVVVFLCFSVMSVSAHGYIVRSIPEDRSTLDRSPTRLQYWFSESLETEFSSLRLRDSSGNIIAEGGVDPENNALMLLQLPPNALADGAYVVELRPAFSSDGHAQFSTQVFFVGESLEEVASIASSTTAQPLEVVWKALLLGGVALLFGTYALYNFILVPAWGNPKYMMGLLPPRVMQRLNLIIWVGLFLAIMGNILALLQQTMVFFDVPLDRVITGNLWQVVRIGSRFGDVWNVRMIFLIALLIIHSASLLYRDRHPRSVQGFWSTGMWAMALIVGAQAVSSHAAGSLVMPWVAISMHWLHAMSTTFWVGGVVALALVLPVALQPYQDEVRQQALLSVMSPFSKLMVAVVAIVITSGIYNSTNWFFSTQDLQSSYGGVLALKILMLGLFLGMAAVHHIALRPQLAKRLNLANHPMIVRGKTFIGTLRLEVVFAFGTLFLAGALSSTPIPQPTFLDREIPPLTQTVSERGYEVTVSIVPGGIGMNTFDVTVLRDGQPVEDMRLDMQVSQPSRDVRGEIHPLEYLGDGLYTTGHTDIDQVGEWWIQIELEDETTTFTRFAYDFQISGDANVITSIPPSPLTILAGFATIGAIALILYAPANSLYSRLDLQPQNVFVATAVIAITIGMMVFGAVFINQQLADQDRTLNPLPQVVNTVLSTQDSINRGKVLYDEHCVIWQSVTDFQPFMRLVDESRDEFIYATITNGWRDMPACNDSATFTPEERWDIVNYVRRYQRVLQLNN
jgi:putative copper export protein/methionine-rich copper-binding protein CopC/mono/diheme cytochrome c family protein